MNFSLTIALGSAIIFASVGDILLSKGMRTHGEVDLLMIKQVPRLLYRVAVNPFVIAGVASMAVHLIGYATALAMVDVSVANPMTALSYVIATGYAATLGHERVGIDRWTGVLLITAGAVLVGLSS